VSKEYLGFRYQMSDIRCQGSGVRVQGFKGSGVQRFKGSNGGDDMDKKDLPNSA